ncbi:unnamed protein product [Staurois parvus]|uniref:Uncharacterized protein n=1 Tax=Staurois parvus TaxID=386267 RepID=A0ABN9ANF2_9NEOB|nr:unnamed protein product [Staurois parvus]
MGFFELGARTQGPHDPLLPGGPMSCQSAPGMKIFQQTMPALWEPYLAAYLSEPAKV